MIPELRTCHHFLLFSSRHEIKFKVCYTTSTIVRQTVSLKLVAVASVALTLIGSQLTGITATTMGVTRHLCGSVASCCKFSTETINDVESLSILLGKSLCLKSLCLKVYAYLNDLFLVARQVNRMPAY